jgi:hypothetical protein
LKFFGRPADARLTGAIQRTVGLAPFGAIAAEYFERPMKSDFYVHPAQNLNSGISLLSWPLYERK